jgi:hypothetical protein
MTEFGVVGTVNNNAEIPRNRRQLTATTTLYLLVQANFSAGTVKGYGVISARRIR